MLSVFFINFINSEKIRVFNLKKKVSKTLNETRLNLLNQAYNVLDNQDIKKFLLHKKYNSLQGLLSASLKISEIDQIQVFDKDCKILSNSFLQSKTYLSCNGEQKDSYHWSYGKTYPFLSLVKEVEIDTKNKFLFVFSVELGKSWLTLYPNVDEKVNFYGSLDHSLRQYFLPSMLMHDGKYLNVSYQDNYYQFMGFITNHTFEIKNKIYLLLFCLSILIFLFLIFWTRKIRIEQNNETKEILDWFEKAGKLGTDDLYRHCYQTKIKGSKSIMEFIVKLLQKEDKLNDKINDLKHDNKVLNDKIQQKKNNFMGSLSSQSLSLQLRNSGRNILLEIDQIRSMTKSLESFFVDNSVESIEPLKENLLRWKQGLNGKDARKFIRSLAETPGHLESKSLLDEQIFFFNELIQNISNFHMKSALVFESLRNKLANSSEIICHWLKQSGFNDKCTGKDCLTVKDCLSLVNLMLRKNSTTRINFDLTKDENLNGSETLPKLERPGLWVTILYQMIQSFESIFCMKKNITFVLSLKAFDDGNIIILSLLNENFQLKKIKQTTCEDYKLVKIIMESYGVDYKEINTSDNNLILTLSIKKTVGITNDLSSPNHQNDEVPQFVS